VQSSGAIGAIAADADGGVTRVEFFADGRSIGIASAPPYAVHWSQVPPGRYVLTAVAVDNDGAARASAAITVDVTNTTGSPAPSLLPSGWSSRGIGAVTPAGSATASGSSFTVAGSGADIWGTADAFHFAYRTLTGDGSITARVASLQAVDAWTKAGVMMRETLEPGSKHAMMIASSSKGLAFQRRTATGGVSTHTAGPAAAPPYWVRLVRTGHTFSAFVSATGSSWTLVGTQTISMAPTIHVGLPLTSHREGSLATASFEQVTVTGPE
jgi:regulation of enolase protein 1 (concanavalin A-like superfamily)